MSEPTPEHAPEPGEITGRNGMVLVRVGNRTYPAKSVAQCRTCRSKYRSQIEQGLIGGMTYQSVMSELVDPFDDHSPLGTPGYQSVLGHVNRGHMPVPFSAQRRILEQRATEIGRSVEKGEQLLLDSVSVSRTIVQRGFELMNTGELQPSMNDLMKALQLQATVEGGSGGMDEEAWREALIAYMEIVQRNVSAEVFRQIGKEMGESPVLQKIALRRRDTVAGEIEA